MQHIEYLIGMSQRFLEGQVTPEYYDIQVENYLFDHVDEIRAEDEKIYTLLAQIRAEGTAYFQSDETIRASEPWLLDKDQLRKIVQENLSQIEK